MSTNCRQNDCDKNDCPVFEDCDFVFDYINVIPHREGGTIVEFTLNDKIRDYGDYRYSLQCSHLGTEQKQNWQTIASCYDVCSLIDTQKRLPGNFNHNFYRIVLQTGERVYCSPPIQAYGNLKYSDRKILEGLIRAENIQNKQYGQPMIVLKRRLSGIPCPRCRDFNSEVIKDGGCHVCYGTGWKHGYFRVPGCINVNMDVKNSTFQQDVEARGTVHSGAVKARCAASPSLVSGDVLVDKIHSDRYAVVTVDHAVEKNSIPAVYQLGMNLLPYSDVAYDFPLDQKNAVEASGEAEMP